MHWAFRKRLQTTRVAGAIGLDNELAKTSDLWASIASDLETCYSAMNGTQQAAFDGTYRSFSADRTTWDNTKIELDGLSDVMKQLHEQEYLDECYASQKKAYAWQQRLNAQCKLSAPIIEPTKKEAAQIDPSGWFGSAVNPLGAIGNFFKSIPWIPVTIIIGIGGAGYLLGPGALKSAFKSRPTAKRASK